MTNKTTDVAIIMGSDSDLPIVEAAFPILESFGVNYTKNVLSAHRTPHAVIDFINKSESNGCKVFIAAAGMAASRRGCSTHPCDTEVGALSPRQEPQRPYPGAVLQTAHPEALLEDAQGHPTHTVHVGRPSLDLLVRAAAAQAETRHLAVAACGPAVLVAAAERAVAAARKELRGVRLDFSGADPRW